MRVAHAPIQHVHDHPVGGAPAGVVAQLVVGAREAGAAAGPLPRHDRHGPSATEGYEKNDVQAKVRMSSQTGSPISLVLKKAP